MFPFRFRRNRAMRLDYGGSNTDVNAGVAFPFGEFRFFGCRKIVTTAPISQIVDKNFAPTFPFFDVIFGTFYMPPGLRPEQFGNGDPDFPEGFWGQLFDPLRRRARHQGGEVRERRRRDQSDEPLE